MNNSPETETTTASGFGRAKIVAKHFGVTDRTLQRWAKAYPGIIKTYHPSEGCTLYKFSEVEQFVMSATSQKAA